MNNIAITQHKPLSVYPSTRYMGSKRKLLPTISQIVQSLGATSVLDAFSGSGCVSYALKNCGLKVSSNDFLRFTYNFALASIENNNEKLSDNDLRNLLTENKKKQSFVEDTFSGLYFTQEDNRFIDNTWANIEMIKDKYPQAIAMSSLFRACSKRRPRGIFAYTGDKYDDGRKDLKIGLRQHFIDAVAEWNNAVFDNGKKNKAYNSDIFTLDIEHHELVYIDPPYFSLKSDNDYTRRYHFLEGLSTYWKGVEIDYTTKTKKIKSKPTPFSSRSAVYKAFDQLFYKYKDSALLVSYYSNGIPNKEEIIELLSKYKKKVKTIDVNQTYSFGTHGHKIGNGNNRIVEYLFIAT